MALSDPNAPEPPPAGGLGVVPEHVLPAGCVLWRIHRSSLGAIYFGKGKQYRFDDPKSQYGVIYAGLDEECALLETLVRVPETKGNVLLSDLRMRSMTALVTTKRLRFVDLRGHHLAQLRVDSKIFSHTDYSITQQWSRAFFEHARKLDGLLFHSRHNPERHAVAIFERASSGCLKIQKTIGLAGPEFASTLNRIVGLYKLNLI